MAVLRPTTLNIRGSDLSGSDATANRTYTLSGNVSSDGLTIITNGTALHSADFTFSSNVITFLNIVDNTDYIRITYFVELSVLTSGQATYSSPFSLTRYLGLLGAVPNKDSTSKELLGTGDASASVYWMSKCGILDGYLTLYYGATEPTATSTLTEDTDYTVDYDTSRVTLTASGITALSTDNLYADYKYNTAEILNSEMDEKLVAAENRIKRDTSVVFADSTASDPAYRKLVDEKKKGHFNPYEKVFDHSYAPLVKLQTTVNGAYTTGGSSITLTSASGFPNTGTIYIGGNKVAYTGKSSNVLTIPSSTPSIDDAAAVRGEVIEVSFEPEGTTPSYTVLDPDTEYEIDYENGRIKLLANAYHGEVQADQRIYPSNYLIRTSYMHAWHEIGEDPEIPDEIEYVTNAMAARKLAGRVVNQATMLGLNEFNPSLVEVNKEEIREILEEYSQLNVSSSMYNKQYLS
jgi:hypothetical protein